MKNDACSKDFIKDEKILKIIQERLVIREDEKKQHGEVFTPPELVCEMLITLPNFVWSKKDFKWLDPASGIGNYPVIVYYKLMEGLKKEIPDAKKRSKHIIENMLFMVELNPVNVRVCKKIFKMIDKDAVPNIAQANFLQDKWENKWGNNHKGLSKFQIIMGNPPYQNKKVENKKSQAIWPDFVESSIESLEKNGYLVFVHPPGWRDLKGLYKNIFDLFQERDLQHLTMRTFEDGAKTFAGARTNFDYYCLKNSLTRKNKTKINDIDRNEYEINLNNYNFIPSGKFKEISKLVASNPNDRVNLIWGSFYHTQNNPNVKETPSKEFKYNVVYTITQERGIKCWYSNEKNTRMFVPKVIWSNGTATYPIIDAKGEYGLTQFSYGIHDESKNLEYIKNAMNDPKFIDLMRYVEFGLAHKYSKKIIETFKKDFWKEFDYKNSQKTNKTKKTKKKHSTSQRKKTKKTKKKKYMLQKGLF